MFDYEKGVYYPATYKLYNKRVKILVIFAYQKFKKMKYCNLLFVMLIVMLVSCDDDDESSEQVGLQFKAKSETIGLKSAATENALVSMEEARIGIIELELEAEFEEEDGEYEREYEYEIEIYGPFQVDLLTGISTPEIVLMDIEPGMEYEFECEVSHVLEDGKSVYFKGEVDVNGTATEFIFETNEDFSIEIEGKQGLDESSNVSDLWTVIVDFDYLFHGINFENAEQDENNVIVISPISNENLYDVLEDRLEASFEFDD